ncbi:MAG: hypothetical protein ABL921_04780 [Pirellula sp.]
MASAEVNTQPQPQPLFWRHLALWIRSIPRSALLSMVGPLALCIVGYFGWRYYGAAKLDLAYYGLRKENIHLPPQPRWLKKTNVLDEVFEGSSLGNLSLLDARTPVVLARVFDAHSSVRKTHRVQPTAGQVMIHLEYREPVAMVCLPSKENTGEVIHKFLAVDADSVLLAMENFTKEDVPNYIWIYPPIEEMPSNLVEGKEFGDPRVSEAVKLCKLLSPLREGANITRVYVYSSKHIGKTRWWLEIETAHGTKIQWGSAPGLEGPYENSADAKIKQLIKVSSDGSQSTNKNIDLTGIQPNVNR